MLEQLVGRQRGGLLRLLRGHLQVRVRVTLALALALTLTLSLALALPLARPLTRVCGVDGSGCAPKIYFAWVGTDKHGQNMLSAGRVLSRFAAGSVQGVVSVVNDQVDELTESQDS